MKPAQSHWAAYSAIGIVRASASSARYLSTDLGVWLRRPYQGKERICRIRGLAIGLEDYEGHMGSDNVRQLEALSDLFRRALDLCYSGKRCRPRSRWRQWPGAS